MDDGRACRDADDGAGGAAAPRSVPMCSTYQASGQADAQLQQGLQHLD